VADCPESPELFANAIARNERVAQTSSVARICAPDGAFAGEGARGPRGGRLYILKCRVGLLSIYTPRSGLCRLRSGLGGV